MRNLTQRLTGLNPIGDNVFTPAITDRQICSADERLLLSLPVKKGSLVIPIFPAVVDLEFANSRVATEQLVEHINNQESTAPVDSEKLNTSRRRIASTREELNNFILLQLSEMSPEQLRANDLTKMRGALSWLTTFPLKSETFNLDKREFYDAFNL